MVFLIFLLVVFLVSPSYMNLWFCLLLSGIFVTMKIQQESQYSAMKYFVFQEISSWGVLMGLFYGVSAAPVWGILLKMGLPPFHLWIMSILNSLEKAIKWPLVASKVVPSGVALVMIKSALGPLLVVGTCLLLFNQVFGLKEVMVMSSGYNLSWALLTSEEMVMFSLFFMLSYLGFIYYLLDFSSGNEPSRGIEYLIVLGLPPSGFFFMKIFMVAEMGISPISFMLLILMLGFLLMVYLKIYEGVGFGMFFVKREIFQEKGGWFTLLLLLVFLLCSAL